MVWLDGLDIPFVNHLGATFGEDFDGTRYPESRSAGDLNARFGSGFFPWMSTARSIIPRSSVIRFGVANRPVGDAIRRWRGCEALHFEKQF